MCVAAGYFSFKKYLGLGNNNEGNGDALLPDNSRRDVFFT